MRYFSLAGLRLRLLLLALLAVIPALGLTIYTNLELRRWIEASVREETLRLARLAANDQEDAIKDTRQLLFALTQLPEIYEPEPQACAAFLTKLSTQHPQYVQFGLIAPDGQVICSASAIDRQPDASEQDYFQRALRTGAFTIGGYQNDPPIGSDKATLDFGYPVFDETGRLQGVVFAALDLTWLNQLAAEAQLPAGSTLTVIDHTGAILVRYPDPEKWVGQTAPEAPIVDLILSQQGAGTAEADGVDGVSRLFAFTPLYETPDSGAVYITVGVPTAAAFAAANWILVRNLIASGLVTLLALAAAWFGGDLFIIRWINVLVAATKRLSRGDLSARTGLPYGRGELSQLAQAFDEMADSLERRIAERDQAEVALQESQRTLATLMSNLPGMAYRCRHNRNRTMSFVSEGCFSLTGYRRADLIGDRTVTYAQLIHPEDRKAVWLETQNALQENRAYQIIYRIRTAGKKNKWVWEQGRGVFSARGVLLALEGFVTDITERMEAYQMLEQRVADRTRELAALYDVTAVASKSLELSTILHNSLDHVLAVMECEIGMIHLVDETKGGIGPAAWRGLPANETTQNALSAGQRLAGRVIDRDETLVTSHITAASPAGSIRDSQPYLGAPMRSRGRVLGVLSVIGQAEQQFKVEEVTLLASIADEIGVAVENAQLYEAERIKRRQADTLLQAASVVGSTLELDEVLARILDQLRRVVDYDSASVQLLQEGTLQIIAARGFTDAEIVLETRIVLNETPHHSVIADGRLVNLADAPALYPSFRRPPFTHIRSWLGLPLRVQDRIIGLIAVDRQQAGGYSDEEARLTTAFADLAALALENARLYQQAEQLAVMEERSRLARELHDSVTQSLYSLTLFAEVARRSLEANNLEEVADYNIRLKQVAQQALKEMRLLVYELRPSTLETEGLVGAIQQRLDAVEKRAGVEGRLLVESMIDLPVIVEDGLYRIVQEALNNALKHASATLVTVRLQADPEKISLEVTDNGVAFELDAVRDAGGMGLTTMRERAERLGGVLTISAVPGAGVSVIAQIPTRRSWTRPLITVDNFSEAS